MKDSMSDITPNLSTALDVQLQPSEIYIKEQVNDIFIGDYFYNKRKFLRGVAISWVSLNIVILTSVFVFQYQRDYLKDLYRNWIQPNGYTYFFASLAFICIIIPAIFTWIARKFRIILIILLLISFAYLSSYFLTYTGGVRRNGDEILLTIFMEINAGSLAFFINSLLTRSRYHTERVLFFYFQIHLQ